MSSVFFLSQEHCMLLSLVWTVLQMFVQAAFLAIGVFLQEAPEFRHHSRQTSLDVCDMTNVVAAEE